MRRMQFDSAVFQAASVSRRSFLGLAASLVAARLAGGQQTDAALRIRAITRGPRFHWRGYYDKLLFDPTNRFVLANEVDFEGRSPRSEDSIRVGMVDTQEHDTWIELGESLAWNWQQGCMLQWVPGDRSEVAWNDRRDGQFISHLLDVETSQRRTLPRPFYCWSPDGKWSFAPDFRRLNDTRPGYGYGGIPDPYADVLAPADSGIWRTEMQTGAERLVFSLAEAAQIPFTGMREAAFDKTSKHWFNHLLCNTNGTRLFFLHRWHTPGRGGFKTRAFTMNLDGSELHVLDPYGGTSHFVWRDPEHVFAWAWHPSHGERFYLYRDRTDEVEVVGPDVMTQNGHNTYVPGTGHQWVLNDTYPDADRLQHPYLYHIPTDHRVPLGAFRSPPGYTGEWRCDTHPCASRDGRKVVFDSPHDGGRQVYLVDISSIVA